LSFLKPERSLILGLVQAWGVLFGRAFLLPLFLDGAVRYQFFEFYPIRLIAISFYRRLPIGAVAAISSWRLS
jgi:hypothetical protein